MTVHRLRVWWRRRKGYERTVAAAAFATFSIFLFLAVDPAVRHGSSFFFRGGPVLVDLTLVQNAQKKGAVCLDGSSAGYHLQRGFGSGSNSWVIHLEGGGWCHTLEYCAQRKLKDLGSSKHMVAQAFAGILSNEPSQNPDFFNWNKVKMRYCDGASFLGKVQNNDQNGTTLFFRGQIIWEAVMEELLSKGLENATQALLTGCSAGGLSTFFHCNEFHALLPKTNTVKCLADGGFFLDSEDISGARTIRSFYHDVIHLQDLEKMLPEDCILSKEPSQCFFPQEIVKYIDTPFLVVNSAYDWWQIQNILVPDGSDPDHQWLQCKRNILHCNHKQIEILHGFRENLRNSLGDFQHKKASGLFINSCYAHCQTMSSDTWHSPTAPKINNKTIAEAVGDWYFDRYVAKLIDCQYPCNPTCHHNEFLKLPFYNW